MSFPRWALPLALVVSFAGVAHAGPSGRDRSDAAVLTNKARAAFRAKNYQEAIDSMRRADELDPTPQRKLDLAKFLVADNKLVEASAALNSILNDPAPKPREKWARDQAKKQLDQFESRIPWLMVHVIGPTRGVHVEVDGKEVEPDAESPVNPGEHSIGVDADGYESGEKRVKVNEGQHKQVTITLNAIMRDEAPKPEKSSGGSRWPAIASFAVGGVGLGVGAVFGILAFDETAKAKQYCNGNRCPAIREVTDARDVAIQNGNVSTVGFVIGGVGIAAGIVLLLTSGPSKDKDKDKVDEPEKKEEEAVWVRPYVGFGEAGIVGRF